jgi:hypothetical protein
MATNKPQDSLMIPMHKRIAMGESIDGSSLQPKGQRPQQPPAAPRGGLEQAKKK